MKRPVKALKIIMVIIVTILVLLVGTVALASAYPDHSVLQFFAIENPFTVPQQDTFPIIQILEENDLTQDRIDNIQFAVLPDGGYITVTGREQIQSIWDLLSEVEVTTIRARNAPVNEELAIYVDIQFLNPNHNAGIEIFGQVHIVGHGPFVFSDNASEQRFVELFAMLKNIQVDYTPPSPYDPGDDYILPDLYDPGDDSDYDIVILPTPTPIDMSFLTFLELLKGNGFIYDDIIDGAQGLDGILSDNAKTIILGDEIISVYEYNSNEEMEMDAGYISTDGFGITSPNSGVQISWVSTPYWFKSDMIVVLYVGENNKIIDFLLETFGQPFAGGFFLH